MQGRKPVVAYTFVYRLICSNEKGRGNLVVEAKKLKREEGTITRVKVLGTKVIME